MSGWINSKMNKAGKYSKDLMYTKRFRQRKSINKIISEFTELDSSIIF